MIPAELVERVLDLLRDLALEVVERRDADARRSRACRRTCRPRRSLTAEDGVEDRDVHVLHDRGEHQVAELRRLVAVGVDPDQLALAEVLDGGRGAEADGAGDRHDDVGAACSSVSVMLRPSS
jgi:hypothetical protein